jgi:hypothetical protein
VALYATLNELKASLDISDNVDDTQLNAALTAASGWIDGYCGRTFGTASGTATRDYVPTGMYEPLYIDDCTTVVSVKVDDDLDRSFATTLGTADWQAEPVNSETDGLAYPYHRLRPIVDGYWPIYNRQATVRVEATYGWAAVPAAVTTATILQAARLFARSGAPLGVLGFGDAGTVRVSRFADPDVEMLLAPYRLRRYF